MELGKSGRHVRMTNEKQDSFLGWMYGHRIGRLLLYPLISPAFSKIGGAALSSRFSALFIKSFVKKNGIDLSKCEKKKFTSFNDFFTRKLRMGARPVNRDTKVLPAPCDSRLSVYRIEEDSYFTVKNTPYRLADLLKNPLLADEYEGGTLWLFRLCVDDYHRYIYPVTGQKTTNRVIPGVFHTVNPIANDVYPIYKQNTREFCVIHSEEFGPVLMMEVGAMLVGKIENRVTDSASVKRGEEKGNFAFGGSTIILLTRRGYAEPQERLWKNTEDGIETRVRLGEAVGRKPEQATEDNSDDI